MTILSQVRTCARVLCVAALAAVFVACGGPDRTTSEETATAEQAFTPTGIAGWSGFAGYASTGTNGVPQCLRALRGAILGSIVALGDCSTSDPNENFSLNTSTELQLVGVSATAFTQHQGLCLKNTNGVGCTGLCVGYQTASGATLANCNAASESVNDIGFGWGAIYTNNGGGRCLQNVLTGGSLPWGNCANSDPDQTSWEPMGFTCILGSSDGTGTNAYLQDTTGLLYSQQVGATVIDGVNQPANSAQEMCTVPNGFGMLTSAMTSIEEGPCSQKSNLWLTPVNPDTTTTTNYKFATSANPLTYFLDRDFLNATTIDSTLRLQPGFSNIVATNPSQVGNLEVGTAFQAERLTNGIEPRCVSGL